MTIHLIKLAVGASSLDDVRSWQSHRALVSPPLKHRTRSMPKLAAEIIAAGSIYWVVAGILTVRQRILDIRSAKRDDGTACTDFILDPVLVPVQGRPVRPFQGWRYLKEEDAPADLDAGGAVGLASLPEPLRRDLAMLGLL